MDMETFLAALTYVFIGYFIIYNIHQ